MGLLPLNKSIVLNQVECQTDNNILSLTFCNSKPLIAYNLLFPLRSRLIMLYVVEQYGEKRTQNINPVAIQYVV